MAQSYKLAPKSGRLLHSARRSCHGCRLRTAKAIICQGGPLDTSKAATWGSAAVLLSAALQGHPVAASDAVEASYSATPALEVVKDQRSLPAIFTLADAPEVNATVSGADDALLGMVQVADLLSAATSELLSVKEGSSSFPISDVAQKMSQQAMALASQAVTLASYDIPEPEKDLLFQIKAAAQQVSTIAESIAKQT